MKKHDRIAASLAALTLPQTTFDPRYVGWFVHFNRGEYYEAHDVLEDMWIETSGSDYAFYKGLIQLAGAFVHLRKNAEQPEHPKHANRLRPAGRLFVMAARNLGVYRGRHRGTEIKALMLLCQSYIHQLEVSHYSANPWRADALPQVALPS